MWKDPRSGFKVGTYRKLMGELMLWEEFLVEIKPFLDPCIRHMPSLGFVY